MFSLEILALAIAQINEGFSNPESLAFRLRNPGLLKAYALFKLQPQDDAGNRIFTTFQGGLKALIADLGIKCSGESRAKLKAESKLSDLLACYGLGEEQIVAMIVDFLRVALEDKSISGATPIRTFVGI